MSRINALEDQLADSKLLIERRDTIQRLSKNADFRKVILEDFFVTECARYARESGDPALPPEARADALAIAQAAGHLKRFLNVQIQLGNQADASMASIEEALAEERAAGEEDLPDYDDGDED